MAHRPYTLIAELTYRCALRCCYCSNPVGHAGDRPELPTGVWLRVLEEAEELGVVQVNLTGGEPVLRDDLEALIDSASNLDLYTNLITSGIPLTYERLARLRAAGLRSLQLSFQGVRRSEADRIAGAPVFTRKLQVARWTRALDLPLTVNVVLHRQNIDELADVIELAERLGAERLELANTQYLGWALPNRAALLPTREQIARARATARTAAVRLEGKMEVRFVLPDYFTDYPKACMDGWGRRFIVINPEGVALPCHLAQTLPGFRFDNVRHRHLAEIWGASAGFNRFRGEDWFPDPCRTCTRRAVDFGGCRCQAYHLTGDAGAADPACVLSADHHRIVGARLEAERAGEPVTFIYRTNRSLPPQPLLTKEGNFPTKPSLRKKVASSKNGLPFVRGGEVG
jgi:pyrroloquinoline quinone biosynthesis protein E